MYVIVCLDDCGGMMFNRRRQSKDRTVTEDILKLCRGGRLHVNPYSAPLFEGCQDAEIVVSDNPILEAAPSEYCFLEENCHREGMEAAEGLVCYRWNRKYPADVFCEIDFSQWEVCSQEEWKGYSHAKITRDIYRKKHNPGLVLRDLAPDSCKLC